MDSFDKISLWDAVLAQLQLGLSAANFQTWFKGKTGVKTFDGSSLEISCASPYNKAWIEERYFNKLRGIVEDLTGSKVFLSFVVDPLITEKNPNGAKKSQSVTTAPLFTEAVDESIQKALTQANLRSDYSFSTFVTGQSNQLAYAVAQAVSQGGQRRYNPLLLYGGVGIGKTHLLHAIGNYIVTHTTGVRVLFTSSETFTNDFIDSIQRKQSLAFRSKYRHLDVLLIDDIQFIAGRESTQEEFFHTFNHLYNAGKQIVLTSDKDPVLLSNLQERLRSRFAGGMVAKIDSPELELREAILQRKASNLGLSLGRELVSLIARSLGTSIRDLEGALLRVGAASSLSGTPVTLGLVQSVLDLGGREEVTKPLDVIQRVNQFFALEKTPSGSSTPPPRISSQEAAMYLLRKDFDLPLREISQLFGKHHTSVLYSVNKLSRLVSSGESAASLVEKIRLFLASG
jgi:chromosomal replication initiator protein